MVFDFGTATSRPYQDYCTETRRGRWVDGRGREGGGRTLAANPRRKENTSSLNVKRVEPRRKANIAYPQRQRARTTTTPTHNKRKQPISPKGTHLTTFNLNDFLAKLIYSILVFGSLCIAVHSAHTCTRSLARHVARYIIKCSKNTVSAIWRC